jgi:pyrroloquinoline quinone biosynthesis protein B
MRVRLLGTSAGGGFPQWNCDCRGCRGARERPTEVRPRSQSSVAVSGDGRRWFLLNASPDVRHQIEAYPPLQPAQSGQRGTAIAGVLVTNADLDHTLGLLLLREGGRMPIHATAAVQAALEKGLRIATVLERYGGADWREPPRKPAPLLAADGTATGLSYCAFPVPGKPPRYLEGNATASAYDNVGYRLTDDSSGRSLLFVPDCAAIDGELIAELARCDALLFDGTFWSEHEMHELGGRLASAMAHLPVGGQNGSLASLAPLAIPRKIYVHVNNTNPLLLPDSPERAAVLAAGLEVGEDGMELVL